MPNRWQAIIWTNADPIPWHILAALAGDELRSYGTCRHNADEVQVPFGTSISMVNILHKHSHYHVYWCLGPFSHHLISSNVINYGAGIIWLFSGVNFNYLHKIWWQDDFPSKIFSAWHNSSIYMYYILSCPARRHGHKSHPWLMYIGYSPCILMMIFWWPWHIPQTLTSTLWSVAFYLTLAVPWGVHMSLTLEVLSPNIDFKYKLHSI